MSAEPSSAVQNETAEHSPPLVLALNPLLTKTAITAAAVTFSPNQQLFNKLAASDELRLDYMLQPGEIQLLNNHTQLHARSEFVDYDDVDLRRHLLR
jgi:alpha-ketoglutarate-dependent taurine dioxygenase